MPTWNRPDVLLRCLRALRAQTVPPVEVVVTVRCDDAATWPVLAAFDAGPSMAVRPVRVDPGPLTTAMGAGLRVTTGDVVALTDDDAEPRPDWLERIHDHFADPAVGGVGGRDWQAGGGRDEPVVGRVQWFGRLIGNHHLGVGGPREVEILKGVNCALRGGPLREVGFDARLRGTANVTHWELSLSFAFLARGWKLVYDPAVAVDHHVAPRHGTDRRDAFDATAHRNTVHNETLPVLEYLSPLRRLAFLSWAFAMGSWELPGFAHAVRLGARRYPHLVARWRATVAGRVGGLRSFLANDCDRQHH